MHRGGSLYWQVQDDGGPCPLGKLVSVTRKATRDRPALATLRVPGKIGPVVIRYHRELPADTMVRFALLRVDDLGRYWVTIQYDTAQVRQPASSGVAGVDVGAAVTAATSDGEVYDAPCRSPGQQQRKDRLQRAMARKRRLNKCKHDEWITARGRPKLIRHYCPPPDHPDHDCDCWKHSRRYARDKAEFLKLSQRAARQRTAAAHLASRALADKYAVVVMEDLDKSAMTRSAKGTEAAPGRNVRAKAGLNREILARNWYQLQQYTAYKTQVVTIPAPHTSQQCPRCGHVDKANRPKRDLFRCVACGLSGHADIVAAQSIRGRYAAETAAAQSVAAREICLPEGEQPANSQPNSTAMPGQSGERPGGEPTPGERSHPGQSQEIILQPSSGSRHLETWGRDRCSQATGTPQVTTAAKAEPRQRLLSRARGATSPRRRATVGRPDRQRLLSRARGATTGCRTRRRSCLHRQRLLSRARGATTGRSVRAATQIRQRLLSRARGATCPRAAAAALDLDGPAAAPEAGHQVRQRDPRLPPGRDTSPATTLEPSASATSSRPTARDPQCCLGNGS